MSLPSLSSPRQIRQHCRHLRRGLGRAEQTGHSLAFLKLLGESGLLLRDRRIGGYLAADGELDLAPMIRLLQQRGTLFHLPVLRAYPDGKLWFVRHRPDGPLIANRFGIPEPPFRHQGALLPWTLDTLLLPLVAFDAECNRIGMGGGFYDRTLAYLRNRTVWRRPRLVGVAHECQRMPRLPLQPWDVPLDIVITESRIYTRPAA